MSLVDLATARLHIRADSDTTEDALISLWLVAAERQCIEYLNREVYADSDTLVTAQSGARVALDAATTAHSDALSANLALGDDGERAVLNEQAERAFDDARRAYSMVVNAMVVNESIKAAILLQTAYLYETRQPEADMPDSHRCLLTPYRVGMGV